MAPAALAFMWGSYMMETDAKVKSLWAQADQEEQNADFYRYQADFSQRAGDRQLAIYDRKSKIAYGEEQSAFAKAGVDSAQSSKYLAREQFYGQQQKFAIMDERDMNVRLATLRADHASDQADQYRSEAGTVPIKNFFSMGGSMAGGS